MPPPRHLSVKLQSAKCHGYRDSNGGKPRARIARVHRTPAISSPDSVPSSAPNGGAGGRGGGGGALNPDAAVRRRPAQADPAGG